MATLIVGGLFAIGIIAAVAAVFLTLGERRSQNQVVRNQAALAASREQQRSEAEREERSARERDIALAASREQQRSEPQTTMPNPNGSLSFSRVPNMPSSSTVSEGRRPRTTERLPLPDDGEDQLAAGFASQFRALTGELQSLQQHSDEIERRLMLLNEIAVRLEQMQDGHVNVDQGLPSVPDPNR